MNSDQRRKLWGQHHFAAQLPYAFHLAQRSAIHGPLDKVPQIQRIALAHREDLVQTRSLERPTQYGLEQLGRVRTVEWLNVDARKDPVLPERGDRIGSRLALTPGPDQPSGPGERQLGHP